MKIFSALFITLAVFIASNPAAAGTIRFTGSISEPACVADAAAEHTRVLCSRAASVQELNLSSTSASHAAPWNLASVTQTATRQRRDIVITYR